MSREEKYGYILRIVTNEWRDQVYDLKKYYTGVARAWKRDTPILLAMKTDIGDSFIGYGVVGKVEQLWELPPEEAYCQVKHNNRCFYQTTLMELIACK